MTGGAADVGAAEAVPGEPVPGEDSYGGAANPECRPERHPGAESAATRQTASE